MFLLFPQANRAAHFLNVHCMHVWEEHQVLFWTSAKIWYGTGHGHTVGRVHTRCKMSLDSLFWRTDGQTLAKRTAGHPLGGNCDVTCFSWSHSWVRARALGPRGGNTDVCLCGSWSGARLRSPQAKLTWGFVFSNQFSLIPRNEPETAAPTAHEEISQLHSLLCKRNTKPHSDQSLECSYR